MSDADTVSAVVVTWNSVCDIAECLNSLLAQTHSLRAIVVVDNGSADGTAEFVSREYPKVRLIRQENIGFAAGNNLGIAKTESDWVLTLNPDATIESEWVGKLLEFAKDRAKIGMLGGILTRPGEGGEQPLLDSTGIEIYRSRRVRDRGAGEDLTTAPKEPERVFGICAAAALYRREMLEDVKIAGEVFPASFFCYYEDADLAWRAWRGGWEAWIVPEAAGLHKRGGSSVGARFSRTLTHRNRYWMIVRNDRPASLMTALPQIFAHELFIFLRCLRYPYLFKASLGALGGLGRACRERKLMRITDKTAPPFQAGTGFTAAERRAAFKRAKII